MPSSPEPRAGAGGVPIPSSVTRTRRCQVEAYHLDGRGTGPRMPRDVGERLLHDPVDRQHLDLVEPEVVPIRTRTSTPCSRSGAASSSSMSESRGGADTVSSASGVAEVDDEGVELGQRGTPEVADRAQRALGLAHQTGLGLDHHRGDGGGRPRRAARGPAPCAAPASGSAARAPRCARSAAGSGLRPRQETHAASDRDREERRDARIVGRQQEGAAEPTTPAIHGVDGASRSSPTRASSISAATSSWSADASGVQSAANPTPTERIHVRHRGSRAPRPRTAARSA